MKNTSFSIITMMFIMAESVMANIIVTQEVEVANVISDVKGSSMLRLSGILSDAAMEALSKGAKFSVQNSLTNYLCIPTLLNKNEKGYWKKTDNQNVFINRKWTWFEKDVTKNFSFVIGNETINPTKANLKFSGTLKWRGSLEQERVTLFDRRCDSNAKNVASCSFTPKKKGENFKYFAKEQDVKVRFSVNAKGKANISYKLSPDVVSPAIIKYKDPFSVTNKMYMVIDLLVGTISYLDDVPEGGWKEEHKTTKLVLRKIEPGTFTMGSPTGELGREDDETQHQVKLTEAYYIGIFETTQKQYKLIMGYNPSYYKGDARPVECVSYKELRGNYKGTDWPSNYDVDYDSFFGKLRRKTSLIFDLPTEAQWEFACRAGTTTALNSGKNLSNSTQCDEMAKVGRYYYNRAKHDSYAHTTVGSYLPNVWGLYDMHGNALEWCLDRYASYGGYAIDPKGAIFGSSRVLRGGNWLCDAKFCRSAQRGKSDINFDYPRNYRFGFRIALIKIPKRKNN